MPRLHPFRATLFTPLAGDPAYLIAPPYDVIDEPIAEELRERSPWNAVRLVLPRGPTPERYARTAVRLAEWLDSGILAEDPDQSVYLYRQEFELDGEAYERRSLFVALELEPLTTDGGVVPHEETHRGPKEDRIALTEATGTQLSAVLLVTDDPEGSLARALVDAEPGAAPILDAQTPDRVRHVLSRLTGAAAAAVCRLAGDRPLLIADGHHRYETALAIRERLPHLPKASSVLACIASANDPGVKVLATHRSLARRPAEGSWADTLSDIFDVQPLEDSEPSRAAEAASGSAVGTVFVEAGVAYRLGAPAPGTAEAAGIEEATSVGALVFDRLILRRALGLGRDEAAREGLLAYHKDPAAAVSAAGEGAAFLLAPVGVGQILDAVRSVGRLPPKTTYFAPKIPSGLLFRRLD